MSVEFSESYDEVRQTIWRFTADASNISIAMEYTLSRIIEDLSRTIEEAIHRFREQWNLKRPNDDDLAYIAQIMLIFIIVTIIAGILGYVLYPK
jgi:hypothetical protein